MRLNGAPGGVISFQSNGDVTINASGTNDDAYLYANGNVEIQATNGPIILRAANGEVYTPVGTEMFIGATSSVSAAIFEVGGDAYKTGGG